MDPFVLWIPLPLKDTGLQFLMALCSDYEHLHIACYVIALHQGPKFWLCWAYQPVAKTRHIR